MSTTNAVGAGIGTIYNSGTGTFTGVPTGAVGTILTSPGAGLTPVWQAPATLAIPYNVVAGTSATVVNNNGYAANNAALVTLTMPATSPVGTINQFVSYGAGGFKVQLLAGQQFFTAGAATSVAGSASSTAQYQTMNIVTIVANLTWVITVMNGGSFTLA
jgi:hypothetical protein